MLFDVNSIVQLSSMYGLTIGRSLVLLETNALVYEEQEGVYFTKDFCLNQEYLESEKPKGLHWTTSWNEGYNFNKGIDNIAITSIYDLNLVPWGSK